MSREAGNLHELMDLYPLAWRGTAERYLLMSNDVQMTRIVDEHSSIRGSALASSEMSTTRLTKSDILRLFDLLDSELAKEDSLGELYLVGGAVMCLVLDARDATRNVDAFFKPAKLVREAAARVAAQANVSSNWLNDAVKSFLNPRGEFASYLEHPHLRVYVAEPRYLLAMKCAAMRLGEEFQDLDDARYLLRHLDIANVDEALAIAGRYFDDSRLHPKTRLVLEELLGTSSKTGGDREKS